MLQLRLTASSLSSKETNFCRLSAALVLASQILTDQNRFAQADIHDFALDLVDGLLSKIESAGSAEKVAENDHLMKCTSILCYMPKKH
jgi:hypothetical protein